MSDPDRPDWSREGADWPHRAASRFVPAGGLTWHLQEFGAADAPVLLLLHGTGAASHSFRNLAPRLAETHRVLVPDLPGHGFSDPLPPGRLSLPGMAAAVADLLRVLGAEPRRVAGHSAGAAILARMCLDGTIAPDRIVALNGALAPFPGAASLLFPAMARALFLNPFTPRLFAWSADRAAVERLIAGTGSRLDAAGVGYYRRLFAKPGHVRGALGMMAHWDLAALDRDLGRLAVPLLLVVGGNDRAIRPEDAFRLRDRLPEARVELLRGLGHLAHEEDPARVAALIGAEGPPRGAEDPPRGGACT
ncbi:alpha/beta hydrolase [Methylobacterium gregans]|uniref:Tropinesterase n=1 Tax=Methylobacterium gregans TaxID=374424 RepID=A0AA37HTE5_9HYPH|nr:alpha/beta fold hydrolase BchO [Methylobacterium gregans]MDQ0521200.1 magnesium chelatase accessory protein [Methylobacterium gregans]GJD81593.1 Tropinesterase [Methylobacterium gregans]GLS54366.1 alpha/beta hydrolase [Methylobacterium gregans]